MSKKSTSTISPKQKVPSKKAPPPAALPPPSVTRGRTTRARSKKRSRDEDLSNFVPIEEATGLSKREQALEQIRQAKKSKTGETSRTAGELAAVAIEPVEGQLKEQDAGSKEADLESAVVRKVIDVPDDPCVSLSLARLQKTLNYNVEDLRSYHYVGASHPGEAYPASKKVWGLFSLGSVADQLEASLQVPLPAVAEGEGIDDLTLQEMMERALKAPLDAPVPSAVVQPVTVTPLAEAVDQTALPIVTESLAIVPYSPTRGDEEPSVTGVAAAPASDLVSPQKLSPTTSYMEDLASEEKVTDVPSNKEKVTSSEHLVEVSSTVKISARSFEHLWANFKLTTVTKELLKAYAKVDPAAFEAIEKTSLKPFRKAKIKSLGQILSKLASWSFEVLLSDELKGLEISLSELESYGVPCAYLKHKIGQLQLVKPVEFKAILSEQALRHERLLSQVNTCANRRDSLDQKIEELQAEMDRLLEDRKTAEVLLEASERDLEQVEIERAKTLTDLSQYFPGENPITMLSSVRDFFSL